VPTQTADSETPARIDDDASDGRDTALLRATIAARLFGDDLPVPKIGRYPVLARVGEGGMGIVYACYDDKLDRRIAVKVVREHLATAGDGARMLREAQAMARLSHPNIVHVYEVGEHDGRLFVAMEFVQGTTLRQWCSASKRHWLDVLRTLLDAGRGLAAAHADGLVHRDFKPDNVMVGDDARVRVMDFGLARMAASAATTFTGEHDSTTAGSRSAETDRAGTPAYMAPEQLRGESAAATADQFAYCVTFWEALHGSRPFVATSLAELFDHIEAGVMQDAGARTPRWLRRVLARGLAADPARRFASMHDLLAALERGAARRRRAWAFASLCIVGVLGAGVWGVQSIERARRAAACDDAASAIDAVWNADASARLRDAAVATGVAYAASTHERATPILDAYVDKWRTSYADLCRATEVDAARDAEAWGASQSCLEERRGELEARLAVLTDEADATSVQRTIAAVTGLSRIDACSDEDWLARNPALVDDEGIALRRDIWRVDALEQAGKWEEGRALADDIIGRARAAGQDRLLRRALMQGGQVAGRMREHPEAERWLDEAFDLAMQRGELDDARAAAIGLVYAIGYGQARHEEAAWWGRIAEDITVHLGLQDAFVTAALENALGSAASSRGDYEEAERRFERAIEIRERDAEANQLDIATGLNNLAATHSQRNLPQLSRPLHERALAIREGMLGPDHPDVANSLSNLAAAMLQSGSDEFPRVQAMLERALAIREGAQGPDHPTVAAVLNVLGGLHYLRGAFAESLRINERALAIRERVYGPDHPDVAMSLDNVANAAAALGDLERADALFERELALREKIYGADHVELVQTLNNLAGVVRQRGAYDRARALYSRALAIAERQPEMDADNLGYTYVGLAQVELASGDAKAARVAAERGLALRVESKATGTLLGEARFVLARALGEHGDEARAIELARAAKTDYRGTGEAQRVAREELDAWLAQRER
jgi:tetratricopeptide (TPR) repeat protein/predicted Ser/Thr protein kinase